MLVMLCLDVFVAFFNISSMLVMFNDGLYSWAAFNLVMALCATWHMAQMVGDFMDGEVR
jgi:hypothetical protein